VYCRRVGGESGGSSVGCARRLRRPRSPCIGSPLNCARRWRCPRSPCTRPFASCARRFCRPRSPRAHSCVGHVGISSSAASSWPSSPSSASPAPPAPPLPACSFPLAPALLALAQRLALSCRTCLPLWPSAPSGSQTPPVPAAGSCAGRAWMRTSPGSWSRRSSARRGRRESSRVCNYAKYWYRTPSSGLAIEIMMMLKMPVALLLDRLAFSQPQIHALTAHTGGLCCQQGCGCRTRPRELHPRTRGLVQLGVVECAPASLPPASFSLTHALRMDGFCNQNANQLGSLAGPSLLTVYVGVVECAPASPYTYSSSTHRFPDERTPIEATPLPATSAELGLGLGLGLGLDSLSHSSSHALPFFSPPSFHTLAFSPAFTSVWWSA
jgi:hypothetical protein